LPSIVVLAYAESAADFVVFGAVAFSVVMSFLFFSTRGSESAYDRIGAGGMTRESDYGDGAATAAGESPALRAEREREIRQMLSARSERLVRRGEPALDIDAELARLLAASSPEGDASSTRSTGEQGGRASDPRDPGLVAEVRQLVMARNERRARQGQEPLDVDAEVARTLDELDP
jgi:hypothetical protein